MDLRLVYHLLSIHQDMQRLNLGHCTVWVQELPSILDAADGHSFVMNGVLAFAATHLAWLTDSTETKNLAYHHRGVALKGLHDAIGNFSRESSDAILAASILLSWQTSDWSGWASLMQGISTIFSSMTTWFDTSVFASFIETHPGFFLPRPLVSSSPFTDDQTLISAIDGLQRLLHRLAQHAAVARPLQELLDFAHAVKSCSATMQCEAIFTRLQPMRARLFWAPVSLLSVDSIGAIDLVLLAQLYTVALAVDISLPELRGAALGSLTARCIDDIDQCLRYDFLSQLQSTTVLGPAGIEEAMLFPRSLAARYRHDTLSAPSQAPGQKAGHQSLYDIARASVSTLDTPGFPLDSQLGFPVSFGTGFPLSISRSAENLNTPASPYPHYGTPASRRQSYFIDASPNPWEEISFDRRSDRGYSFRGGSPAYSSSFHEDDLSTGFPGHSPASYPGEHMLYDDPSDKGKQRQKSS